MYALLKNNICIGVHSLPLDDTTFAENERQVELKNVADPVSILGKTYVKGKFVETEKTDEEKQIEINLKQRLFLADTDWKVIRHRDQLDMGIPTSMSDEEYKDLLAKRQKAREGVIE